MENIEKIENLIKIATYIHKRLTPNEVIKLPFSEYFKMAIEIEKSLILEDIKNSIENIDNNIDTMAINLCEINLNTK